MEENLFISIYIREAKVTSIDQKRERNRKNSKTFSLHVYPIACTWSAPRDRGPCTVGLVAPPQR